jgi:hypothetical protein
MSRPILAIAIAFALASTAAVAKDDGHDIDKVNGSITAEAGQPYGSLETVNGSINFQDGAHAGSAETVNGSIEAGDSIASGDLSTVNGHIHVGNQAQIDGGVETVNGSVFVDRGGRLAKGIETVNGAIGIVATELAGGIETVNGDITVGVDSHLRGGIKVTKPSSNWLPVSFGSKRKPRIIIGPNAVVDGPLVFEREVVLYVHKTARIGTVTGATPIAYDTARAPQE